jgi:glycosyltransferase involved in cell wall biosynthesis
MEKVIIGLPNGTGITRLDWSINLAAICTSLMSKGYQVIPVAVERSFVDAARNAIIKQAQALDADWVFFLDDDTYITPKGVLKLLLLDKDISSPPVADRKGEKTLNVFNKGLNKYYDLDETKEVSAVGMATTLIKRKVIDDMIKEYATPFEFQIGKLNGKKINISEDVGFCLRAAKMGYKTWAVKGIKTDHLGEAKKYTYEG